MERTWILDLIQSTGNTTSQRLIPPTPPLSIKGTGPRGGNEKMAFCLHPACLSFFRSPQELKPSKGWDGCGGTLAGWYHGTPASQGRVMQNSEVIAAQQVSALYNGKKSYWDHRPHLQTTYQVINILMAKQEFSSSLSLKINQSSELIKLGPITWLTCTQANPI